MKIKVFLAFAFIITLAFVQGSAQAWQPYDPSNPDTTVMRFQFTCSLCNTTDNLEAGTDNQSSPRELYMSNSEVPVYFGASMTTFVGEETCENDWDGDEQYLSNWEFDLSWSGVDSSQTSGCTHSSPCSASASKTFAQCDDYEVTCTAKDIGAGAADGQITMHWLIHVRPADTPDCDDDPQKDGCDSGIGCSSCGGGGDGAPLPSTKNEVVVQPSSLPGPGCDSSDLGLDACERNHLTVYERCGSYCSPVFFYRLKDSCGVCHGLFGPLTKPVSSETTTTSGPHSLRDGAELTIELDYHGNSVCKCTYPDGTIITYEVPAPAAPSYDASAGPSSINGPNDDPLTDGSEDGVDFAYNQQDPVSGDYYNSATTSGGQVWRYYHAEGATRITKVQQQVTDAPYTQISYNSSGSAEGKVSSVVVYDHNNHEKSRVEYSYYSGGDNDGKLWKVTKGTKQTVYTYDVAARKITVDEQDWPTPPAEPTTYSRTVYHYFDSGSTHETHITGKNLDDLSGDTDQTTVYSYYYDSTAGVRTVLKSVTDPMGGYTEYEYWDDPESRECNGRVKEEERFNADSDPLGSTYYAYNNTGAVTVTERRPPADCDPCAPTVTQTTGYYLKDGQDTPYVKWTRDARGTCTYYDRTTGYLHQVDSVRVSAPLAAGDPDAWSWPTSTIVKQTLYYGRTYTTYGTGSSSDGKPGQVWVEMTMDDDGETPLQTICYKYSENGKYHDSPTQTRYVTWDSQAGDFVACTLHATTTTSYDDFGRVDAVTDANSRTVTYGYDDLGRQTTTTYAQDVDAINHYSCCNLEMTEDENGNYTYYAYDAMNRTSRVWSDVQARDWSGVQIVDGKVTNGKDCPYSSVEYTYDSFGNVETVTTYSDANHARITSYTYDKLNRVTKIDYPDGIVADEEFGYDDYGNLLWKKDGKNGSGYVTLYEYDTLGRLKGVYYNYGGSIPADYGNLTADVTYGYDAHIPDPYLLYVYGDTGSSLKTWMTDSTGTSRYSYDIQGRLRRYVPSIRNTGPGNAYPYVIAYDYNNLGQKTSMKIGSVDPQCALDEWSNHLYDFEVCDITSPVYQVDYNYYDNGWLHEVVNAGNSTTLASYTYDAAGLRQEIDYGNGTSTEFDYDSDPRYRVSAITHKHGAAVLADISYRDDNEVPPNPGRDKVGNPLRMEDWTGTWSYGYDGMNRLTSATAPAPIPTQPAGGSGALAYGYDWVGNRIHPPSGSNPMVYNKADQLTSWPGMHQYTYYPDGSLEHVKNAGGTSTLASYTYTASGLLATASYGDSRTLTNTWDADANRATLTTPGPPEEEYDLTREFVYDPTAGVPAVVQETEVNDPENPNDDVLIYYFRDPGGSLISRVEGANTSYYHFDALGSARLLTALVGENVVVTDKYAYDAYGALVSHDRTEDSVDQPYQYVGQLGYYTHYQEPEFALLQLGVRFYDPEVGGFTQLDPIRFGANWYSYVGGNPTVFVDPEGLWWGQLMFGPSCRKVTDFVRYVSETHGGSYTPHPKKDNWYAVDAIHVYCSGGWTTIKIPDAAMCRITCKETGRRGCKRIEMDIDCSLGFISRNFSPGFQVDPLNSLGAPEWPKPTHTPKLPPCICGVDCKQTGVPGWTP